MKEFQNSSIHLLFQNIFIMYFAIILLHKNFAAQNTVEISESLLEFFSQNCPVPDWMRELKGINLVLLPVCHSDPRILQK